MLLYKGINLQDLKNNLLKIRLTYCNSTLAEINIGYDIMTSFFTLTSQDTIQYL